MTTEIPTEIVIPYKREPIDIMEIMDMMGVNPGDPVAHPDAMKQNRVIHDAISGPLGHHLTKFDKNPAVFLDYNTYICCDRSDLSATIQPNCYVVFGVDSEAIRRREVYLPWEAGKVPDFTLDVVASEDAAKNDVPNRLAIYERMGVSESWFFDITGGELLGKPILGYFLADGKHRPAQVSATPNGTVAGYSPAIDLIICCVDDKLRFRKTGDYLQTTKQVFRENRKNRLELDAMRKARKAREAALAAERAAHDAERAAHDETLATLELECEKRRLLEDDLRRRESEKLRKRLESERRAKTD